MNPFTPGKRLAQFALQCVKELVGVLLRFQICRFDQGRWSEGMHLLDDGLGWHWCRTGDR
jgi:hypothetical protein